LVFEWPQPEFQFMGVCSFNLWGMQFHFMGSQFQLMVQTTITTVGVVHGPKKVCDAP
jgi:hypothetical protein